MISKGQFLKDGVRRVSVIKFDTKNENWLTIKHQFVNEFSVEKNHESEVKFSCENF